MRILPFATAVSLLAAATPALAHPKLLSTSPGANAIVSATRQVQLVFSEPLIEKLSKVEVSMTMTGHGPMKMPGVVTLSPDHKTVTIAYSAPLHSGAYTVNYQVVSTDTHKVAGSFAFRVR